MILGSFRRDPAEHSIRALYGMIVAQARSRAFYADYGVPDTVEGRFDLLVLHLVLTLRQLGMSPTASADADQAAALALGQKLFDLFCRDLEHNLREMGVGDLAVPKRMQRFGEAFYGRQQAYCAALAATDNRELEAALARNILQTGSPDARAARLALYARAAAQRLEDNGDSHLVAGVVSFPHGETVAHA